MIWVFAENSHTGQVCTSIKSQEDEEIVASMKSLLDEAKRKYTIEEDDFGRFSSSE
jgi:hypothetical protein